ncbi:MAG: KOW domain-containing RNA-binding protein [Clostridia bacterium]|nr:KOW domain-containing RNA-binding protein [Clostridia bacterium]
MNIRVVFSKAGRDKGKLMAVVNETEESMLLCDGKERRLEHPKAKNKKHVAFTNYEIKREDLNSNRSLRKALHECSKNSEEELICQKKI